MKFSVIGPTYPFRGGISHYTSLLVRHLRLHHGVQFLSYSRQYPGWLYPGKTDHDPSAASELEEAPNLRFDALSFRQWWRVSEEVGRYQPEGVILPWSAVYWAPFYLTFLKGLRRFKKIPSLFICHNVFEHETSPLKTALSKITLRQGDAFLSHSEWDKQNLLAWLGQSREPQVKACVHPLFQRFSEARHAKKEARLRLGIQEEKVLLFFGFIREYKGLEYLLESMRLLREEFPIRLVIAGEVWGGSATPYTRLIQRLQLESQVTFYNRYIPNEEVAVFFDAADLVVIPYVSASQSGVVQLSFAFGKPVVVGDVGGLSEAVADGKTGYLVPPRNAEAIVRCVKDFYTQGREATMAAAIREIQSQDSWSALRHSIESLIAGAS